MASGGGLSFRIRVDDREVLAGLRAQRRAIRQDIKRITLDAAKREVLPVARASAAPSRLRKTIIARSTTSGAYLGTSARGTDRATIGLLNFGGTVTTPIRPRRAKALRIGPGLFRASVTGPRRYRAKGFLERSVQMRLGQFSDHVERELTRVMQARLTYARTFG